MWLVFFTLGCDASPPASGGDSPVDSASLEVPVEFDATYDVIVVGSGPAGAAAAIEAEAAGASVVMFERETTLGFGVRLAGQFLGVDTPWQEEAGIEDSLERAQADWQEITGVDGTRESVTAYLQATNGVLAWAESLGATVHAPSVTTTEGSTSRTHTVNWLGAGTPYELLTAGSSFVERAGVEVTGPVLSDGVVVGVTWRDVATGETGATGARGGVVVATGGFLRNPEAVAEVRPEVAAMRPIYETQRSSTGGGLPFFEAIGAGREAPENIGAYLHSVADPREPDSEAMILMKAPKYIFVDSSGRRFTADLPLGAYLEFGDMPETAVWLISGVEGPEDILFSPPAFNWEAEGGVELYTIADLQAMGADGVVIDADLATAALVAGVDPAVVDTLDEYNLTASTNRTDEFGVALNPGLVVMGSSWVVAEIRPGLAKNFGGVLTDSSSRVLKPDGTPIEGVWAAGECVGMIPGGGAGRGFTGSASALYHGGRMAGAAAAARSVSAP